MKKLIIIAALLVPTSALALECSVEDWTWRQSGSRVIVEGITTCPASTEIYTNFRCDGKFIGTHMNFVQPGGGFKTWVRNYCDSKLSISVHAK